MPVIIEGEDVVVQIGTEAPVQNVKISSEIPKVEDPVAENPGEVEEENILDEVDDLESTVCHVDDLDEKCESDDNTSITCQIGSPRNSSDDEEDDPF